MSDNVEILNLDDSSKKWANNINKYSDGYIRRDMLKSISDNGFDIEKNVKDLEVFYLNASSK